MATGRTHKEIVSIFELRFDYQSARIMVSEALDVAGIDPAKEYDGGQVDALATAIGRLSSDAGRVVDALAAEPAARPEAPAAAPAPAAEPTPVAETAPEPEAAPAPAAEPEDKAAPAKKAAPKKSAAAKKKAAPKKKSKK